MIRFFLAISLFLTLPLSAWSVPENIVKPELVADLMESDGSSPFRVGVYFRIKPDWHIYWKYPGETGLATEVSFALPEGFKIGEVNYPVPDIWEPAPGIIGYGYEKEVLLSALITPQVGDHKAFDGIPVKAKVNWLSCGKGLCVPEERHFTLEIPVGSKVFSRQKELFDDWNNKLPIASNSELLPFTSEISRKLDPKSSKVSFQISLTWQQPATDVYWIPNLPQKLKISKVSLVSKEGRSMLSFDLLMSQGVKIHRLESLVLYNNSKGSKEAVIFPIKLW